MMLHQVWRLLAATEIVYRESAGEMRLGTGGKTNKKKHTLGQPASQPRSETYPVALQYDSSHGLHCRGLCSYKEVNSLDQRSDHHKALNYECHHKKNG
jgi:hypothetical protein